MIQLYFEFTHKHQNYCTIQKSIIVQSQIGMSELNNLRFFKLEIAIYGQEICGQICSIRINMHKIQLNNSTNGWKKKERTKGHIFRRRKRPYCRCPTD